MPGPDLKRALFRVPAVVEGRDIHRFLMGAQATAPGEPGYDPDAGEDEGPVRWVTLSPFYIQRLEVSLRQYRWCIVAGKCRVEDLGQGALFVFDGDLDPGRLNAPRPEDERPINGVSWEGARRYCAWIGARLPSEAEWEYSARNGPLQSRYPWGEALPSCERAIFAGSPSRPCEHKAAVSTFVRARAASPSHIMHQAGNLWEWTADWYAKDAYEGGPTRDPTGPLKGTGRVQRGGSFSDDDPAVLRGAFRAQMDPALKMPDVGFRCAADRVDHRPITHLVDFATEPMSTWEGEPAPGAGWELGQGWIRLRLSAQGEVLRWRDLDYGGESVLSLRVFPQLDTLDSVALVYGVQDARNHYRAEVYPRAGVARLVRVHDGVEGLISEGRELTLPNDWWLSLHLRWSDGHHVLSNSTMNLTQGQDETFRSGGVGLRVKGEGQVFFEPLFTTP